MQINTTIDIDDFKGQGHGRLLDRVHKLIVDGAFNEGMDKLYAGLRYIWLNSTSSEWAKFSRFTCLGHPLMQLLHADPLTSRVFHKPRGYPGDAIMMDHIYFRNKFMNEFQGTGAKIYAYTSDTAGPRAIRRRREIIAHRIDEIASRTKGIKVLSMAAGHLREVELSRAFESGAIAEWVALDHDEESLEEVVRSYGDGPCIRTIGLSVRRMLQERITLGEFDLVYASGLYDYLGQPVAKLLTENLFAQLKPGGVLVISNFLPGILDVGFMETYMDWRLIFRDKAAMEDLSLSLPQDLLAHQRCFTEESGNIIFLELTRR